MNLRYLFICLVCFSCNGIKNKKSSTITPNVLLIVVDDLNDWVGYLDSHPQARTPNIDRLASRGVAFTNAHANAPICGPSRTSMLTGLLPSSTGVYLHIEDTFLTQQIDDQSIDAVLLPKHFEENGYKTMGVGKIFHKGDQGQVFNEYGGLKSFGPRPDRRFEYDPSWFGIDGETSTDWGVYPSHDSLTFDKKIADWAIEQLGENHNQPFFLAAGFMRPHVPWYAPQKWFEAFDSMDIEVPKYLESDWDDIPEVAGDISKWPAMPKMDWMQEQNQWEEAVKGYLASVQFVDYHIGRLLDALESSEYASNTLIVLTSDHGYHLGEKGLFQKGTLWKRSTHIPMVIAGDGIKAGFSDEPVSLLDLYPTLIDLTGTSELNYLEGKSLEPILSQKRKSLANTAVTTFGYNNHSVYQGQSHYIRYEDGSEELYNLAKDPNEWVNLAGVDSLNVIKQKMILHLPVYNAPNNEYSRIKNMPYFSNISKRE